MSETTHACSKCKEHKPISSYQLYKDRPTGQCRQCKSTGMRELNRKRGRQERKLSRLEGDNKLCVACNTLKPLTNFRPNKRGLGGVASYCTHCHDSKYRQGPESLEKQREAVYRYRANNREVYLANHRLHAFKRRTAQEVTSDGTVTDVFLRALYSTHICYYCERNVSVENRTADHKTPLSRGGLHSSANLVMACWPCNTSKNALTEEEFRRTRLCQLTLK